MNGRIYDPLLGRFLSADIAIQAPGNLQSYNRYSYVMNNPLTLTDPTGFYSFLGLNFTDGGGVGGFVSDSFSYVSSGVTGAAGGLYGATVGGAVQAGNEAGQMYVDSRDSGSSGLASFGYATSEGLGRFTGGTGLVEFYSGTKIEEGSDGSLKTGEFSSVSDWALHGAGSFVQAASTAVGAKAFVERLGQAAPKAGLAPEVDPAAAPSTIQKNAQQGKAFEKVVGDSLKQTDSTVAEQVTVRASNGVSTRLDFASRAADGTVNLTEAKSSATAPLTKNQSSAFPAIAKSGGVVTGEGKPGFPGGTTIPPTKVNVVRPPVPTPPPNGN